MSLVRVYIDGFNLYHAIDALQMPHLKWLNLRKMAETLLRSGEELASVHYFTAVLTWDPDKQKRHVNYLTALRAVGVGVHEANFKKVRRHCQAFDRYCRFHEEKQTDVALAIKLVTDALSGDVDRQILVTADSDQIPTARFIKTLPRPQFTLVFPPGRRQDARDLGNAVADKLELSPGRLGTCLLPRTVLGVNGRPVAFMPTLYQR